MHVEFLVKNPRILLRSTVCVIYAKDLTPRIRQLCASAPASLARRRSRRPAWQQRAAVHDAGRRSRAIAKWAARAGSSCGIVRGA
eukprot:COSAG05_NODE_1073_length_5960_cov_3.284422_5_plen_85_part_00